METSGSVLSRPRYLRSRLRIFSSFVFGLVALVLVSGFFFKSFSATVDKDTRRLVVDTADFRKLGLDIHVVGPHRTDRGDKMASTEQRVNWSQLVGMNAEEAKKKIQEDHPHLQVVVVPKGSFMTMDYNLRRVRVFKDQNQNVASVPKLG